MSEQRYLKAIEILTGRIMELETDLNVSQYHIDKLKKIIEKAEGEADK